MIKTIFNNDSYTVVEITTTKNRMMHLAIANNDASKDKIHSVKIKTMEFNWVGTHKLFKN